MMSMGAVLHMTGRINGSDLGGLYRSMPKTAALCIVGAASISAFPPVQRLREQVSGDVGGGRRGLHVGVAGTALRLRRGVPPRRHQDSLLRVLRPRFGHPHHRSPGQHAARDGGRGRALRRDRLRARTALRAGALRESPTRPTPRATCSPRPSSCSSPRSPSCGCASPGSIRPSSTASTSTSSGCTGASSRTRFEGARRHCETSTPGFGALRSRSLRVGHDACTRRTGRKDRSGGAGRPASRWPRWCCCSAPTWACSSCRVVGPARAGEVEDEEEGPLGRSVGRPRDPCGRVRHPALAPVARTASQAASAPFRRTLPAAGDA